MRACIFTYWIPTHTDSTGNKIVGHWSEEIKGKFHQWGTDLVELSESAHTVTIAIVEDIETGKVYRTSPEYVQFVKNN